jgi:hypothetical protein
MRDVRLVAVRIAAVRQTLEARPVAAARRIAADLPAVPLQAAALPQAASLSGVLRGRQPPLPLALLEARSLAVAAMPAALELLAPRA